MGNLELQDSVLSQSDLIFQFIYVQSNTWMQSETAKKFPSHSLYQLIVKTINGDTLGVYGQAIFYEGKQSKFSRPFQTEHFIMSVTFPIAFENLINRFLNDTRTIDRINQYNQTIFAKSQNNKRLDSIIKLLNRFDFIRSKVDQVKYDLACLGIDYNSTAQSVQESKQTLDESKQLYGDNPVVQFSSFISGAIFSGQDKKALARNNEKLVILKSRSVEISEEENELIKYMTDHNVQSSAINVILKSRVLDETTLSTIIDNLNAKQADISGQIK
jgi:hypothetical protein